MTALFDEPLRVTLKTDQFPVETEHAVGLLLGFALDPRNQTLHGIVCLADGRVDLLPSIAYTIDWRYDVERDLFHDLQAGKEEQDT